MELNTPYYVINKALLDANYKQMLEALNKYWNNYIIGYSYKTNALPWIIKYFKQSGCYAEVVSENEYHLAQYIGVNKENIIYNGPIKTKKTFIDAIRNRCIVNIDSQREINWLDSISDKNIKIGIRINFNIEDMCPGQSQCADEGGRFGFCYENGEFDKAVKQIMEKGFIISGLHLHTSSKTRGIDIYKSISNVACKIVKEYDFSLDYVDVGGGFFGGLPDKPQFDEYIKLIAELLSRCMDPKRTTLVIEPGMALIGSFVRYVTTVIDVKDTTFNRFVITDGSRIDIDPLMRKSSYFHFYEKKHDAELIKKQVICGCTCMEHDRLFISEYEPELEIGDRIIYDKVGAYTMCLTPLFIKYFPDVYVESYGELIKVRTAWGPGEYTQKALIEEKIL